MMYGPFGWGTLIGQEPALEIIHRPPEGRRRQAWPLLFVHGAHAGAWCWDEHFLPWFAAKGYDCYALSLRGHGRSRGKRSLHFHGLSDYVRDLCRAIEPMAEPPVVIGHSMGGMVIQKYLEDHSLPGAVLMASVPPSGLVASVLRLLTTDPELFNRISLMHGGSASREDLRGASRAVFSDNLDSDLVARYGGRMQGESQRALMDMTFLNLARPHRVHPCPMLVLGAADDALFSADEVRQTADAYDADYLMVDGLAHAMMLEGDWIRAAKPLHAWLQRLAATGSPDAPRAS